VIELVVGRKDSYYHTETDSSTSTTDEQPDFDQE
jgi:hypothetical protein